MRLIRKSKCETLRGANAPGAVRAFSMMQASVQYFPVELDARGCKSIFLPELESFFNAFYFKFV